MSSKQNFHSTDSDRKRGSGIVLFGILVGSTVGLGSWQLYRYKWKVDLIQERDEKLKRDSLDLSFFRKVPNVKEILGRRIHVSGVYDHSKEVLVGPRSMPKSYENRKSSGVGMATNPTGFYVLTPLVLSDGSTAIVNRGWVPQKIVSWERPTGVTKIVGIPREGEKPNRFSPVHDLSTNKLMWIDLPSLIKLMGLDNEHSQLLIDEAVDNSVGDEQHRYPLAKRIADIEQFYVTPETHLMYACTWFSLAAFATAITIARFKKGHRLRKIRSKLPEANSFN